MILLCYPNWNYVFPISHYKYIFSNVLFYCLNILFSLYSELSLFKLIKNSFVISLLPSQGKLNHHDDQAHLSCSLEFDESIMKFD